MSAQEHERIEVDGAAVTAVQGDLTRQEVAAVVNAANVHLKHGGGVAGALARGGGPQVQRESDAWVEEHGPLQPGVAADTTAGALPADRLIHVAGPVYEDGQDNQGLLRQAVAAALGKARELGARTVAFPAISAGIYGYPQDEATAVIADEVLSEVREDPSAFDEVRLVGFDEGAARDFADGLRAAAS